MSFHSNATHAAFQPDRGEPLPGAGYDALRRVSRAIATHHDIKELFRSLADELRPVVNFVYLRVFLCDKEHHLMRLHVGEAPGQPPEPFSEFPPEGTAVGWVYERQAAGAQARHEVTAVAYVPFEFAVGNRMFPAGTYVFEIATGSPKISDEAGVLVVRNSERGLYVAVATGVAADSNIHAKPGLAFRRDGDRVYLGNVWCQGSAAGLKLRLPQGVTEIVEREAVTLDATMTGGI